MGQSNLQGTNNEESRPNLRADNKFKILPLARILAYTKAIVDGNATEQQIQNVETYERVFRVSRD